jgi:hypothetical protein
MTLVYPRVLVLAEALVDSFASGLQLGGYPRK